MVSFEKHPLTWSLIIANVLIFIVVFSLPNIEAVFEALSISFGTKFEAWRWITSMFMHASASHLFFNMLGLYFFGKALEEEVKKEWFIAIYFISGLIGSFVFMITDPSMVVGASAAVFGLMGAAMLLNPVKKVYLYVFPLPLSLVAVTYVLFATMAVYFRPEGMPVDNVAHIAHLGGAITGAIFAFFYEPKRSAKGVGVLLLSLGLLIILAPIFALLGSFSAIILGVIDSVVGLVLYSISGLLSTLWG